MEFNGINCTDNDISVLTLYNDSLRVIHDLRNNLEQLTGVMIVMKEDLQIKDEQFDFLYASIRARTEQSTQSRDCDEQNLRARVELLESIILERDFEKEQLQRQLSNANRKLILLTQSGASTCWLNSIPDEVLYRCISFLEDKALALLSCANKRIYASASEDSLWMHRFRRRWGPSRELRVYREDDRGWKQLFYHCNAIDENWQRQRSRVYECKAHSGTVTCLALCGDRLVSGSDDGSMAFWDLSARGVVERRVREEGNGCNGHLLPPPALPLAQLVGLGLWGTRYRQAGRPSAGAGAELGSPQRPQDCSKVRTFHGHGGPVWCLDYDPSTDSLVSGSYDCTLKVWDTLSGSCTRTLRGHTGWVSSLQLLHGTGMVASASWDSTIRLWGLEEEGTLLRTISSGLGNALYCIGASKGGGVVGVGCRHAQVQLWDLETGVMREALLGHSKEVYCIQMCERIILSGSGDTSVKVWDNASNNRRCVLTIRDHTATVMSLQYDNDYKLVTGSYDKTVKVWDIRSTSAAVTTIAAHQAAVFALKFDDSRLVTGGADHTLKVFNFATASSR